MAGTSGKGRPRSFFSAQLLNWSIKLESDGILGVGFSFPVEERQVAEEIKRLSMYDKALALEILRKIHQALLTIMQRFEPVKETI